MTKTSGYMVVRRPEFATGVNAPRTPSLGSKIYRGIDRLPWEDLFSQHGQVGLKNVLDGKLYDAGIQLTTRIDDAMFCASLGKKENEVLSVYSPYLGELPQGADIERDCEFLGFETFALGEWSIHRSGPFFHPELFQDIVRSLNEHGLFWSEQECCALEVAYQKLSITELVEPLQKEPSFVRLSVYSVGI